ncbi:MAG: creatininase family protein [Candidatus Omnitrophica bacterium]|nr:creatininase family protein [Candidatus Omnitrophota bacterium]
MDSLAPRQVLDWDLASTNLHRLSKRKYEVAVLPTGSTEPHNLHLPEGQDSLHTTEVARRSVSLAWKESESILLLPALPYGVDCNLLSFPLAIHVSQAALDAVIRDILGSLVHHGIQKVVVLNGHGGNDFVPLIRQVQCDLDVHVFLCNWWLVGADKYAEIFEKPDDHAGELETSVALALFPQLVEPGVARDGQARAYRFEALEKGWVRTSRNFARLNDHCATGDPSLASAEKGQKYLALVCERIAKFLVEVADSPLDETFPHVSESYYQSLPHPP